MVKITDINAREILDSRGNPTVETSIVFDDGSVGISSVPSGASTGKYEALELRDGDNYRYRGMGVLKAVENVNGRIKQLLINKENLDLVALDNLMLIEDGTDNKSKLGANAILSVSMAFCEAMAKSQNRSLYRYLNETYSALYSKTDLKIPTPLYNLINGGKHGGGNNLDFQEFHLIINGKSFPDSLRISTEIYHLIGNILREKGYPSAIGDEGGYAPDLSSNEEAFDLLLTAADKTSYKPLVGVSLGLDCAATSFYKNGKYLLKEYKKSMTSTDLINLYKNLSSKYPLILIEDGLAEEDWTGWSKLNTILTNTINVGDDLLCTNPTRIQKAIEEKACSGVLIKPNQIGTISETFKAVSVARNANLKIILSHRSGETQEDFIADLAVAIGADMVKFGAPARGERVVKYNRLLVIDDELRN